MPINYDQLIFKCSRLVHLRYLQGFASKEEDLRAQLYYFLLNELDKKHKLLLNSVFKFKDDSHCFPDILIILPNNKKIYIELKLYTDKEDRASLLPKDIKTLKKIIREDKNYFYKGFLIHYARNFTFPYLKKGVNSKAIIEYCFPNEKDKAWIQKKSKKNLGWIPIDFYIEQKTNWVRGNKNKSTLFSLVDLTKNSTSPIRFLSDLLKTKKKFLKNKLRNKYLLDYEKRVEDLMKEVKELKITKAFIKNKNLKCQH